MADKITRALVTAPTFINGVLHQPGELAAVDLEALGVDELGDKTPGLQAVSAKAAEEVVVSPVAAVAPHAPDAPNPQGIPPGTVQSGTGRLIQVDALAQNAPASDEPAETVEFVGADRPGVPGEQTPQRPARPAKK